MLPTISTFHAGDWTLDRSQGGLGLGLTLVRRLTEHARPAGGSAQRRTGKGSEFVVRLPLWSGDSPDGRKECRREPVRANNEGSGRFLSLR